MKKVPGFVWAILACLLCIIGTALVCLISADKGRSSDKYLEILNVIDSNYYKDEELADLEDASAAAMLDALGDPWSFYMTPEEYEEYKLSTSNQYIGIGITTEFSEKYGFLSVVSVAPGSPADLAHIKVGNMVASVDNIDVSQFTPSQLNDLFRSYDEQEKEEDRYFTLHLLNTQGGKADAKLKCELIYDEPVSYYVLENTTIGYIRIANFEDSAASCLKAAISALEDMKVTSIILDVRDNGGGKAAELADALDTLLPKGDLFLLRDQNGKETSYSSGASCIKTPIVVMVNENTACAAEVFANVLQTNGGVTVVGKSTQCNGRSQVIVELADGSAVSISRFEYLTPDKKSLDEIGGVVPDIASYQIEDSEMDVQLEAAKDAAA